MTNDNLSEKVRMFHDKETDEDFSVFGLKDVQRFITEIQVKVLTDWKGQNEFVDWLKKEAGDDLK